MNARVKVCPALKTPESLTPVSLVLECGEPTQVQVTVSFTLFSVSLNSMPITPECLYAPPPKGGQKSDSGAAVDGIIDPAPCENKKRPSRWNPAQQILFRI